MPVRAVLFDLGNVLVELQTAAQRFPWLKNGDEAAAILKKCAESRAFHAYETGAIGTETFFERVLEELAWPYAHEDFRATFGGWVVAPYAGAAELLASLRGRYRIGCLSNTCAIHWELVREKFGLLHLFDAVLPSHEIGAVKPEREAYLQAARALGVTPGEVLFLDDLLLNVEGAREVGMQSEQVFGLDAVKEALANHGVIAGEQVRS